MIQLRHRQPSLWHSGLAKDIEDLWEPWMKEVDQLLEDAALVESVYDAQGKRHPNSRTRGRVQTPAEVALRLLILKHVRNWSYDTLKREVRANLVYRAFTRIGDEKVPDAKTLAVGVGRVVNRCLPASSAPALHLARAPTPSTTRVVLRRINRNPRSSLILGVAAAEVGFKQFASKTLPDTAWLLEFPSPPLFDMLQKFPWKQL